MQINFTAKKLKEANEYVNLLNPPKIKEKQKIKKASVIQKVLKFLFK